MRAPHDDDALAPDDPLAAFLPALRADAPVREAAVDAVKGAVRGDVATLAATAARDATPATPRPAIGATTLVRWLATPRPLRLSPLAAAATLAVVALGGTLVGRVAAGDEAARRDAVVAESTSAAAATARLVAAPAVPRVVRFTLRAPDARRVALVGDFNGWDATAAPLARRGDEWTIVIPVAPGRHVYGFVVDDAQWIPDPAAPQAETEFGAPNSVLVVGT
jgi:hypothetical protein